MNEIIGTLEEEVEHALNMTRVSESHQEAVRSFLSILKVKSEATRQTYEHSIRVGLLSRRMAQYLGTDEKALLISGLLHDVGKIMTKPGTLEKKEGWSSEDEKEIENHVLDGYRMIRGIFNFSAEIILRHHRRQEHPYPSILPEPLHQFSQDSLTLIEFYAGILAIADTYDAFHRKNDKNGKTSLTPEQIKEKMLKTHKDQEHLLRRLYEERILE